jgi:hypothetical protein
LGGIPEPDAARCLNKRVAKQKSHLILIDELGMQFYAAEQRALANKGDFAARYFVTAALQPVTRHSRNIAQSVATGFDLKGNFRKDAPLLVGHP